MKINKIKEVINQLQTQHEKVTKVKVAELTGYHRNFITENWNDCFDEKENVQLSKNVQDKSVQTISNKTKSVQKIESKNVYSDNSPFLTPLPTYSDEYNQFLIRCIKDPILSPQ